MSKDFQAAAQEALSLQTYREAGTGTTLKSVEIFSAGTWNGSRKVAVTPAMLNEIVSNFDNLNSKVPGYGVPIKLGHNNRVGEPAYGWMDALARVDDTLVADFSDVDPQIVDAISKRRYNSVSVELWPAVEYGAKKFENVLSGVALLGAEWPAVKGLKPLSASVFAEGGEKIELSTKEIDDVKTFTETEHDTLTAAAVASALADQASKLTASETRAVTAEAALKQFREDAEKGEIDAIIKAAEAKGQIVPATKAKVVAFAEIVRKSAATGAERTTLITSFKEFVEALPAKVKFGEQGSSESHQETDASGAADKIDAKTRSYMAAHAGTSYEKAVAAVLADPANEALKTAYAQEM